MDSCLTCKSPTLDKRLCFTKANKFNEVKGEPVELKNNGEVCLEIRSRSVNFIHHQNLTAKDNPARFGTNGRIWIVTWCSVVLVFLWLCVPRVKIGGERMKHGRGVCVCDLKVVVQLINIMALTFDTHLHDTWKWDVMCETATYWMAAWPSHQLRQRHSPAVIDFSMLRVLSRGLIIWLFHFAKLFALDPCISWSRFAKWTQMNVCLNRPFLTSVTRVTAKASAVAFIAAVWKWLIVAKHSPTWLRNRLWMRFKQHRGAVLHSEIHWARSACRVIRHVWILFISIFYQPIVSAKINVH